MIVRRIARPLLSSIFIAGGIDSLRNPTAKAPVVERATDSLPASVSDKVPADPVMLVRINAAVQVGAGAMLAVGKAPRIASLVLAGSLVPTTVVGHPFWEIEDPAQRSAQRTQFFKNLSLLGGLLIAAVDTEGKPSLGWRGRRAVRKAQERVTETLASDAGHPAVESAISRGEGALDVARERGAEWADLVREHGTELAELARVRGMEFAELARERGGEWSEIARTRAGELSAAAGEQAEELGHRARRKAEQALDTARERAAELQR